MHKTITESVLLDWAAHSTGISSLAKSDYFALLLEAYRELDTGVLFTSRTHGQGHIERTMLLGALIAQGENFTPDFTRLLLLCCSYHDIGRKNDWRDNSHGARSAAKINSSYLRDKFLSFGHDALIISLASIEAHSIGDKHRLEVAEAYGIEGAVLERYKILSACLKDADNLDRVRIHDLDPSHLRRKTARELPDEAQWIYNQFRKLEI